MVKVDFHLFFCLQFVFCEAHYNFTTGQWIQQGYLHASQHPADDRGLLRGLSGLDRHQQGFLRRVAGKG